MVFILALCEDGWEYAVNKCWKKGDGCHNFNNATQICVSQNSSLAVPANKAENFLIGQYFPNNSIWVGLNDREKEGDWVTNENVTSTYQNWMIGKPDGGNLENCATLRHSNGDRKWDDVSCSTCNKYICSKGTLLLCLIYFFCQRMRTEKNIQICQSTYALTKKLMSVFRYNIKCSQMKSFIINASTKFRFHEDPLFV